MITVKVEITELENGQFTIRNRICDAGTPLEVLIAQTVVEIVTMGTKDICEKAGGGMKQIWGIRKLTPVRKEGDN